MHQIRCPDWDLPIRRGNDFIVCPAAKVPLATAPTWVHDIYAFGLALLAFSLVFGAFAANKLSGAMDAVPKAQTETAEAYGMSRAQAFRRVLLPQMWVYALPGLSNLWMILIKATPLLFLLGIRDIVFWARELGGAKTSLYTYPHPDWRVWYFLAVLIFYLLLTWISQIGFERLMSRLSTGQATAGGERLRRARA
jgi:polar amino acid transport system permease protein